MYQCLSTLFRYSCNSFYRFLNGDNEMKRIFGSKVVKLAQRYNVHMYSNILYALITYVYTANSAVIIKAITEPQCKSPC